MSGPTVNAPELRQPARPGATSRGAGALANVPAAAAETLLWLQPAADAAQLTRADLARGGRFVAAGEVHRIGDPPLWRENPSVDPGWLAGVHQLPMLVDLAQAWLARRDAADLAAWSRIAQSWLACMGSGELAGADALVEAKRVEHCVTALLLLRSGGALAQLPPTLVPRLVDRVAGEVEYLMAHLSAAHHHRILQLHAAHLAASLLGPCLATRSRTRAAAQSATARELLVADLMEDFGSDGVHRDGSTQLHQVTLHAALSFVAVSRALGHPLPPTLHRRLRSALEFSLWTTLPDGGMPLAHHPQAASNAPLLALGTALYLLPDLDHMASGGQHGEPPEALGRHFPQAGYVALRDGWHHQDGAQHLFHGCADRGTAGPVHGDPFSLCYTIAGRQVLVDSGRPDGKPATGVRRPSAEQSRGAAAAPILDPLVRLGTRSALLRTGAAGREDGAAHTRCLAYVMRQYVLLVDRVHAEDGAEHEACFTLRFAPDWQDRIVAEDDGGRGAVLRGASAQGSSDWRLLLDAPAAQVALGSGGLPRSHGGRRPAPSLHATQAFRDEAFFACAIGPQRGDFALHALDARHGAARSVLTVTGESAGRPFVDRLVVHWQEPGLLIRPDYHARAGLALERRVDGTLEHLMLAETGEWFTSLHPVHASRVPDTAGDLEW